jgi:hypothetical protein
MAQCQRTSPQVAPDLKPHGALSVKILNHVWTQSVTSHGPRGRPLDVDLVSHNGRRQMFSS